MQVVDEMNRKLGMAREQVDLAQARKEELWEKGGSRCPVCQQIRVRSGHQSCASCIKHCSSWLCVRPRLN
jgi:hypothetical protein